MNTEKREITAVEVWVRLDDVLELVSGVRGSNEGGTQYYMGWEFACEEIRIELEDIRESA